MKYVKIVSGVVTEIQYDQSPAFHGVPVSKRVPPSYFASLIPFADDTEIQLGWILGTDGMFHEPIEAEVPQETYTITTEETERAYREGVNSVE